MRSDHTQDASKLNMLPQIRFIIETALQTMAQQ